MRLATCRAELCRLAPGSIAIGPAVVVSQLGGPQRVRRGREGTLMSFDVCGPGHQGRRTRAHGGPWGKAGGIRAELDLLIGRCATSL